MKKLFALVITVALLLTSASIAFADESTPVTRASVSLDIDGPLVTSPIQKEYIRDVLGVDLTDSTVISITDLSVSAGGKRDTQGNKKAIKLLTTMEDGTIEVGVIMPMVEDADGDLVNAFELNPNYLSVASSEYATRADPVSYSWSIPDLTLRVDGYYTQGVISSHYVYRMLYGRMSWMRRDPNSSYKVNRLELTASVCGDLYDTSFNLIEEDYSNYKTKNVTNPVAGTYYRTDYVMSTSGNVVTVAGMEQKATLDWIYWFTNSAYTNRHDTDAMDVFHP